jgi:GPH family glycoside/pentoside/hexuronide:cation symporter
MSKERPEFSQDEVFTLRESIKTTFKSRTFLIYSGFYFCQNFLGSFGLSYLFVYLLLLRKVTPGVDALLYFFIIYYIVGFASNYLSMRLVPRFGMRKIILWLGTVRVVTSLGLFLPVLTPAFESLVWLRLVIATVCGGYAVFWIPMQFLAIDEDEILHGTRREGMFIGSMALLTKPAASLGPIVATLILTTFGYVQGGALSVQPESVFFGIKLLFMVVPAIGVAASLVFIYFYPLHGERLKKMQEQLKKLHEEKRAALAKRDHH